MHRMPCLSLHRILLTSARSGAAMLAGLSRAIAFLPGKLSSGRPQSCLVKGSRTRRLLNLFSCDIASRCTCEASDLKGCAVLPHRGLQLAGPELAKVPENLSMLVRYLLQVIKCGKKAVVPILMSFDRPKFDEPVY